MYRPPIRTESSTWRGERAVRISRGVRRRERDHQIDPYAAVGYAIRSPFVARPDTPRSLRNAGGTSTRLPVSVEATCILVMRPGPDDSGQPTRWRARRKDPCAWPR
jgi:hypothetical protein